MKGTGSLRVPMEGNDLSVWNSELRDGPIQQSGDLAASPPCFFIKTAPAMNSLY